MMRGQKSWKKSNFHSTDFAWWSILHVVYLNEWALTAFIEISGLFWVILILFDWTRLGLLLNTYTINLFSALGVFDYIVHTQSSDSVWLPSCSITGRNIKMQTQVHLTVFYRQDSWLNSHYSVLINAWLVILIRITNQAQRIKLKTESHKNSENNEVSPWLIVIDCDCLKMLYSTV